MQSTSDHVTGLKTPSAGQSNPLDQWFSPCTTEDVQFLESLLAKHVNGLQLLSKIASTESEGSGVFKLTAHPPPPLSVLGSSSTTDPIMQKLASRGSIDETVVEASKLLGSAASGDKEVLEAAAALAHQQALCSDSASGSSDEYDRFRWLLTQIVQNPFSAPLDTNRISSIIDAGTSEAASRQRKLIEELSDSLPCGRHHTEVWEEQYYLRYQGHKCLDLMKRLKVVEDWRQVFPGYVEDHDGFYREYSTNLLERNARQWRKMDDLEDLNPIIVDEFSRSAKRLKRPIKSSSPSNKVSRRWLISPPVPISSCHPASWSLSPRVSQQNADFSCVHPAACMSSSGISAPRLDRQRTVCELDMAIERYERSATMCEAFTCFQLGKLLAHQEQAERLAAIDLRNSTAELALSEILSFSEKNRDLVYLMNDLDAKTGTDSYVRELGTPSVTGSAKYQTRCASGSLRWTGVSNDSVAQGLTSKPPSKSSFDAMQERTACQSMLNDMMGVGSMVEVFREETQNWELATIEAVKRDNSQLLRHIKVRTVGPCSTQANDPLLSVWMAANPSRIRLVGSVDSDESLPKSREYDYYGVEADFGLQGFSKNIEHREGLPSNDKVSLCDRSNSDLAYTLNDARHVDPKEQPFHVFSEHSNAELANLASKSTVCYFFCPPTPVSPYVSHDSDLSDRLVATFPLHSPILPKPALPEDKLSTTLHAQMGAFSPSQLTLNQNHFTN